VLEHDLMSTRRQLEDEKAMSQLNSQNIDNLRLSNGRLEARVDALIRQNLQLMKEQEQQQRREHEEKELHQLQRRQPQPGLSLPPGANISGGGGGGGQGFHQLPGRKEGRTNGPLFSAASSLLDAAALLESSSVSGEAARREPPMHPNYGWPPPHHVLPPLNGEPPAPSNYWAAIESLRGLPRQPPNTGNGFGSIANSMDKGHMYK